MTKRGAVFEEMRVRIVDRYGIEEFVDLLTEDELLTLIEGNDQLYEDLEYENVSGNERDF